MHNNMRIWSAAVIIAAVLVVGFLLSVPHLRDASIKRTASAVQTLPPVYLHDSYKKGTHTITVKVAAPNSCIIISGTASVEESTASGTPDTILVALDMPADTGVCLQVPATTTLSLSAAAGADAVLNASINGNAATSTSF